MVMVLPPYVQLVWLTVKFSGFVSNQAVIGNFDSPSPGLLSQDSVSSAVFARTSSDVN